jgi:hypothetical protein
LYLECLELDTAKELEAVIDTVQATNVVQSFAKRKRKSEFQDEKFESRSGRNGRVAELETISWYGYRFLTIFSHRLWSGVSLVKS